MRTYVKPLDKGDALQSAKQTMRTAMALLHTNWQHLNLTFSRYSATGTTPVQRRHTNG